MRIRTEGRCDSDRVGCCRAVCGALNDAISGWSAVKSLRVEVQEIYVKSKEVAQRDDLAQPAADSGIS